MKRLTLLFIVILMTFTLSACYLDVYDDSHDDEYVVVSTYFERVSDTFDVIELYYIPQIDGEIIFYDLDENILEKTGKLNKITYELRGNYKIETQSPLNIYMVKQLAWVSITENDYIYSESKLETDILVQYGILPIIGKDYELGDTIRVIYQENNLSLHYVLARQDNRMFVRYGDIRELLI